jgi:SAM-dependent methyltransferase
VKKRNQENSIQSVHTPSYSGIDLLQNAESGLKGYNSSVVTFVHNFFKPMINSKSLLVEFGAGTGSLAEIWVAKYQQSPICIEIDPDLIKKLKNKGFQTFADLESLGMNIDFVYSANVLEHIQEDVDALKDISSHMKVGAKLAIYVPALPILFSELDYAVGHVRRYRKMELIDKVQSAGFRVEKCFYNDSIGVLATFAVKILGFNRHFKLGGTKSLLFYDRVIYPASRMLDNLGFRYIVGKNIILFASRD